MVDESSGGRGAGPVRLFRSVDGPVVEQEGRYFALPGVAWDVLFNDPDLYGRLLRAPADGRAVDPPPPGQILAPLEGQEVWAAGVTYLRSKTARMEEAQEVGGSDFYDRVYAAARPELFFKATRHRVAAPGRPVRIRRDARWNVPEPELALAVSAAGRIVGYTVGNDMSARDIEGENPLYLPQAKVYDACCALGPAVLVTPAPLPAETEIRLVIERKGATAFEGSTALSEMKRQLDELVRYLFLDNSFPLGCFLLTGTGIVPPDEFTLRAGDRVRITIDPIGTLENPVVQDQNHE